MRHIISFVKAPLGYIGNVYQGLPAAEQRHADAFYLAH